MPKAEWGTKRACPKCAVRFYDLNKDPIVCPCGEATFDLETILETYKKPSKETTQKTETIETTLSTKSEENNVFSEHTEPSLPTENQTQGA